MKMGMVQELPDYQQERYFKISLVSCLDSLSEFLISNRDLFQSYHNLPDERLVDNYEFVSQLTRLSGDLLDVQAKLVALIESLNHSGPGKIKNFNP